MQNDIEIVEAPPGGRESLDDILRESFEGWYLRHARKTLHEVERVRVAVASGRQVGVVMLKTVGTGLGYVYYVAVARSNRKQGVGSLLLDDALRIFKDGNIMEVFASVEEDNQASEALFAGHGFVRTTFSEVSSKHGALHTINLYRIMVVVPGEILLHRMLL